MSWLSAWWRQAAKQYWAAIGRAYLERKLAEIDGLPDDLRLTILVLVDQAVNKSIDKV